MTQCRRASFVGLIAVLLSVGGALSAQDSASTPPGVELMAPSIPDEVTGTLRTLNATLSRDLDPKDNVVVDLVALLGPQVFELPLRRASLAMLGIDKLPATGVTFLYLQPYAVAQGGTTPDEQARLLEQFGCDWVQGYLYGRPMPAAAFEAWLENDSTGLQRHAELSH